MRLLVVFLDGVGREWLPHMPFLASLRPRPLYVEGGFTHVAVAAFFTGQASVEEFWDRRAGRLRRHHFSLWDLGRPTLVDELTARGVWQLYVNVPLMWPPRPLRGAMICDGLQAVRKGRLSWPEWLGEFAADCWGYVPDLLSVCEDLGRPEALDRAREVAGARARAFAKLAQLADWGLAMVAFTAPDRLLHYRRQHGDGRLAEFMGHLDSLLEGLFLVLRPERYLVWSDHGFTPDGYHGPDWPETWEGLVATDLPGLPGRPTPADLHGAVLGLFSGREEGWCPCPSGATTSGTRT